MNDLNDLEDLQSIDTNMRQDTSPANLPNAVAVLVLGICSIVTCWLWGIIGLACGIIALALHKKDKELYRSNPAKYAQSYKNSQAGFICGIIGVSLSAIFFVVMVFALITEPRGFRYRF